MEGTVEARFLEDFELDYVVSLIGIKGKNLVLSAKKSRAQDILNDKNWPLLIGKIKCNYKKEHKDIKISLERISSSIESFHGFKSDPLFKGISGRLVLLSQRVNNFTVEGVPELEMLLYAQFKYQALAQCYELKTKLIKNLLVDTSIILKEREQGFTSNFKVNFEYRKLLGRGAFGVVLEMQHKYDKHLYALKRVRLPIYPKSQIAAMREVQALGQLQHKNIVRYYCSWVEEPLKKVEEEDNDSQINQSSSSESASSSSKKRKSTSSSPPKKKKSTCGSIIDNLKKQNIDSNHKVEDEDLNIVFVEASTPNEGHAANAILESKDKENKCEADDDVQITKNKAVNRRLSRALIKKKSTSKRRKTPAKLLYIQMELCKGGNLRKWLQKNKNRDYFSIINIYLQILDAVAYLHKMKLIHRDLKPGNIFFNEDNIIKVGDFGLVLDIGTENKTKKNGTASYRNHTKGIGTQFYMSPELCSGGNYDYKVDVYALGIIFFELLYPFSTMMERVKVLTEIRDNDVYPDAFKDANPEAYPLIKNMLENDPETRFTVNEIRDEILKLSYENNIANDSGYDDFISSRDK